MMKKICFFLFISFALCVNGEIEEVSEDMSSTVSLDLRNIEVVDALRFLAMKANMNIVATKAVAGRVNLQVENVSVKDIFDVILRSNGLAYDKRGTIYKVTTEEEYKALYGESFSDIRQVKIIHLSYAIPEQVFGLCDTLKSDVGRVLVDPETGAVVIMDSPEKLEAMEEAIDTFEKENIVKVFTLNYAPAEDIAEQLKSQLDAKKVGSVRADPRSNQLIIQTLPERMKQIESLIKKLDTRTKEVLIDAKIIKVKLTDNLTRSVEWEGLFDIARRHGLTYLGSYPFSSVQAATDPWRSRGDTFDAVGQVGSFPFSGTTSNFSVNSAATGAENIHIGVIGKHDFDVLIKYFQDIGETKIISTPKVIVTDEQEARIHVGEKQAYVTSTTTTGQTTSTVSEEVTFVDVGTQLFVTPSINEEGFITLKVKTEVSNVVSTLITPTGNRIPIIDTSLAETTVMTKDGVTIVIGGLRGETTGTVAIKTPFFSSIPLVGKFFTSEKPRQSRTELLILITPHLVTGEVLVGSRTKDEGISPIKSIREYRAADDQDDVSLEPARLKAEIKGSKEE